MNSKFNLQILLIIIIPFIFCGLVYLFTRPDSLVMFKLANKIGADEVIFKIRYRINLSSYIPIWVVFNLPAFVWSFSFTLALRMIWQYEISLQSFTIFIIPTLLGVSSELFQLTDIINGTFDIADLALYIVGGCTGFIFVKYLNHRLKTH